MQELRLHINGLEKSDQSTGAAIFTTAKSGEPAPATYEAVRADLERNGKRVKECSLKEIKESAYKLLKDEKEKEKTEEFLEIFLKEL